MEAVSNPNAPVEPARRRKAATLKPETGQLPAAASLATLPYAPRPALPPFHERCRRFAVLVCHRPAGKMVDTINDLVRRAIECERLAQSYAYIAAQSALEIEMRLAAAIERPGDVLPSLRQGQFVMYISGRSCLASPAFAR
jgi:hypothetical protein